MATIVGVPAEAPFCAQHGINLFDFSFTSRCEAPYITLQAAAAADTSGAGALSLCSDGTEPADVAAKPPFLVLPVGDALIEPFWPQGLGINRGFHTALDGVWCAYTALVCDEPERALRELRMTFTACSQLYA
jgi:hypothetical protein